jgi:DNA polymerase III subunit gamma/tau
MNPSGHLPLSRKWRPAQFEAVIGQELTVRLLKNSLFRGSLYPVYLLAGQRGCGKTTVGRVFAAAVNCQALDEFMKSPQTVRVPCGACASCQAMAHGNHPDFIEIDAASHTGVDNVRQIIEATSFLPQLGRKKIYLIDEAHMLSKAAFNAFLKILEEPPMSVLFMMATTDPFKIIDTVRSRCFQLFFNPVAEPVLVEYLETICKQEAIACDRQGLILVVRATEGSVRDALNMVERIFLAEGQVTAGAVRAVIGHVTDESIVGLVEQLADRQDTCIEFFQQHLALIPAQLVWKKLFDGIRAVFLAQVGVPHPAFEPYKERVLAISKRITRDQLIGWLQLLFEYEQQFLKTAEQQALLETLLVTMARHDAATSPILLKKNEIRSGSASDKSAPDRSVPDKSVQAAARASDVSVKAQAPAATLVTASHVVAQEASAPTVTVGENSPQAMWQRFVRDAATLPDPVLASVLQKSSCLETELDKKTWRIALPKEFLFFNDLLLAHGQFCSQRLQQLCDVTVVVEFCFTQESVHTSSSVAEKPRAQRVEPRARFERNAPSKSIDVSDPEKWKTAQALLHHFPGTITEGESA